MVVVRFVNLIKYIILLVELVIVLLGRGCQVVYVFLLVIKIKFLIIMVIVDLVGIIKYLMKVDANAEMAIDRIHVVDVNYFVLQIILSTKDNALFALCL